MKKILLLITMSWACVTYAQDLDWNSSAIPDNSLSFNFGSIGNPASTVTYAVTGTGTITSGPARFTTSQGDVSWRTAITFANVSDLKVYTFTFSAAVNNLTFNLYDIDGNNTSGDQAIVTADNSGSPQNVFMTPLDATPPTITGSGSATATATGTQGNQSDDRVQVTIPGGVTTLTIQYGNNPANPSGGGRSFSIGNLNWSDADLIWNYTSSIPDNTTQFNFGSIGSPVSRVTYEATGPGSYNFGPARYTTAQGDISWRSQINFSSVSDKKTYTIIFNPGVCNLTFNLYDIDGDNTNGDEVTIMADYLGTAENVTLTALDPGFPGGPPTITGSGTASATATGTQGNQDDDRVQVAIAGCITRLVIEYGNNPAGSAGTRSFSIGDLDWTGQQIPFADLLWHPSGISDNATSYNFGPTGSPSSTVDYSVTGPGTNVFGPARYETAQFDSSWRTQIDFGSVADKNTYTFTFNTAVCDLAFNLYDIDGDDASGDQAIVSADFFGTPQNITMTALDGNPPTIAGSGTPVATATGTQGNQSDDRVQIRIPGCVTTLTIQYGNNPAGSAGTRSFSIGDMGWTSNTLPVGFIRFSGQKLATNTIGLLWQVGNETDVNRYEIERSTDGRSFVYTGAVTSLNPDGKYTFTDYTQTKGTLFYRIKEVDHNGRVTYSSVIALRFTDTIKDGITLFPNPAAESVFITTNDNSIIDRILIYDSHGKIVFERNGPENKVDISRLANGIYRVRVISTSGVSAVSSLIKR